MIRNHARIGATEAVRFMNRLFRFAVLIRRLWRDILRYRSVNATETEGEIS